MKKIFKSIFAIVVMLLILITYTSCTTDTTGCVFELTSSHWSTEQKGGSYIILDFDEQKAYLTAKSSDDEIKISGRYVIDDNSFVIFNDYYSESFKFYYEVNGENLSLSYGEGAIVLKREK